MAPLFVCRENEFFPVCRDDERSETQAVQGLSVLIRPSGFRIASVWRIALLAMTPSPSAARSASEGTDNNLRSGN